MWIIKGYDDLWLGYPLKPGDPPRPAPSADVPVTAFFTCHQTHQFVRFAETTIAAWDTLEQLESFHCPYCDAIHQTARGCAYLWVES
jgi:hypothetical protein